MPQRIEVFTLYEDGRATTYEHDFSKFGHAVKVRVVDVYTTDRSNLKPSEITECLKAFTNPVTQQAFVVEEGKSPANEYWALAGNFDWALEIGFLPGVTDNVGHTASELAKLTLDAECTFYSSRLLFLTGNLDEETVKDIANDISNPLIQRQHVKSVDTFQETQGMGIVIPKVSLTRKARAFDEVNLDVCDEELETIGREGIANTDGTRRGPLGMSLLYMKAVQDYFKTLGRKATDLEIEAIAQTWSEHCKHTIFASPIDDIKDGLYKHYIKRVTQEIRDAEGEDDFCISVFSDNAGGIVFDDDWMICDKVETHNSPSALDPFGGSITGIGGVNRDCIGFGMGAKPVMNRYGFCLADPQDKTEYFRDKNKTQKMLSPEIIMKGVVAGIEAGGNQSGIPTPQGFVYFDDRYAGKPLLFAGTVGLIPRDVNGKPAHEKKAQPGDRIIMIGGKVGLDGIHGATFSSVALDEGSPATAVQIGDPITQKKFSDAIVKEIRDKGLYNAITDNGAGGLSSSVGEMAEGSGGFHVELDKVPLKYQGMQAWEIWISESQERMTLAVPHENVSKLQRLLKKHDVESWDIGEFTDSGKAHITWQGQDVMNIDMDFFHDGLPETPLATTFAKGGEAEPDIPEPEDYGYTLLRMLGRLNIASKEFVASQYDHNVQGNAVLGPLQGSGRVYADASVSRPVLNSPRGVVLSQGLFPRYSDIDTHHMAQASLDFAVRAALAAGANIDHLALLDNFCWCSSDEPKRLGQLKRAVHGIYHLAKSYGTPFISGKDSMFNDFKGYDAKGEPVKISIPPTLLISGIGVIENVDQAVSVDLKEPYDLIYMLGDTTDELGASEYYAMHNALGENVPETHDARNMDLYKRLSQANKERLCASAIAIGLGGTAVALAKKCIASGLGISVMLDSDMRLDKKIFSESTGRVLVSVSPANQKRFEEIFEGFEYVSQIGTVMEKPTLRICDFEVDVADMEEAYKAPLRGY